VKTSGSRSDACLALLTTASNAVSDTATNPANSGRADTASVSRKTVATEKTCVASAAALRRQGGAERGKAMASGRNDIARASRKMAAPGMLRYRSARGR
jgi:hypothetical protein